MTCLVGFIGLGLMGSAIVERYLHAGNEALVFDLSADAINRVVKLGARSTTSPQDLADQASVVIACLPSPAASIQVALGEEGICHGKAIRIYIETSTMGVQACQDIAAALAIKNIQFVDAPVSGGPRAALQGTLTSMVAAPIDTWTQVEKIVKSYSGKTFLVAEKPGLAQACKLVNNAMSLSTLALACETAVFGVAAGLDANTMIDVINESSGRSAATLDKFPTSILTRQFDYGASVRTAAKDLDLFVREAEAIGMDVSGTRCIANIWKKAMENGNPDRDFTSLIRDFEAPLDITVGKES